MATNFLKLFVRPQVIARMRTIRSFKHQQANRSLLTTDSAPNSAPQPRNRRRGESCTFKARLWDHVYENDRRIAGLGDKFNDREITMHQTLSNLSTRVDTGFAELKTLIASQHAKMEGSVTLITWKIGILGAGFLFVLGFAGPQKTNFTEYVLQFLKTSSSEPTTDNGMENKK
ncbi:hypothetical protein B9Z19DRAFT_1137012 [Tuber borchii]|uniref:Uncharacterized protein n=1 Tax=Tuber borchii TaxID=42251 RepID=A0A2T6ZB00_TUBBO|nr:hypothetical protein B9Z19DRAFT_1137012 [Tuber borchii]